MQTEQFNKLLSDPVLLNHETIEGLKTIVEEHPSFQMAWLLYLKNLKQVKSPDFDAVLKKVAVRVPNRKLLYQFLNTNFHKKHSIPSWENQSSKEYQLEPDNENQAGNSLIDKFLTDNQGVFRTNSAGGGYVTNEYLKEVVENSTSESDELITETLANILLQQKNYEKAQDAYRKLSLKYPEKSVYFATRIKEIEKIKNI